MMKLLPKSVFACTPSMSLILSGRIFAIILFAFIVLASVAHGDDELRVRLKDENGVQADLWVYNNIPQAIEEARRQNKPLFITFRCVPCRDCAAFDADVANGNEQVRSLAKERFVSVRQVEMKGVDLSQFQFDYDLNWAAIFINADGTVYARYGTQSAEGSDAYNSIEGLLHTMNCVLELHAAYPGNKDELLEKRGKNRNTSNVLELPGLRNPAKYALQTSRQNCIHCHNIHDAQHQHALDTGTYTPDLLYKFPLPDNIGLKIDRRNGVQIESVTPDSPADLARVTAGQTVLRMNGQSITSIADMQWVLHHLPGDATQVAIETSANRVHELTLKAGWRKNDFSWRGSMWNAPPRFQAWAPELDTEKRIALGISESDSALEVRWINQEGAGGRQAVRDGLREGDIIVAMNGEPFHLTTKQFNVHLKLSYKVGQTLPLTVLRDGTRHDINIYLVE